MSTKIDRLQFNFRYHDDKCHFDESDTVIISNFLPIIVYNSPLGFFCSNTTLDLKLLSTVWRLPNKKCSKTIQINCTGCIAD